MWNETNPTSLYLGTTWELISSGKYVQTGNTALQVGGSNSLKIEKTNLPAIKLKVDSFTLSTLPHKHPIYGGEGGNKIPGFVADYLQSRGSTGYKLCDAQNGGGENTGSASPNTEIMGSGTPITIQPNYITLKFWKRLT